MTIIWKVFEAYALADICWYAWKNPRPDFKVFRRSAAILTGLLSLRTALWLVFDGFDPSKNPILEVATKMGMVPSVILFLTSFTILGGTLVFVRIKYRQRVAELGQQE